MKEMGIMIIENNYETTDGNERKDVSNTKIKMV